MAQFKVKKGPLFGVLVVVLAFVGLYLARKNGMLGASPVASAEVSESGMPAAALATSNTPPPALVAASVRFCGSNTIGTELAPALAESFLSTKGAQGIRKTPGSVAGNSQVSGVLTGDSQPFTVDIQSAGTTTAFQEMAGGRCDIAMASREASPEERSSLGGGLVEHVLGLDGIAVVVNQSNPVQKLWLSQVSGLFSGSMLNWATVGGIGSVEVVSYDEKSGTYDTFRKLVLGGSSVVPSAKRFSSSSDLIAAVSTNPAAVGFTSLSSARGVKVLAIGDPGAEPLIPTPWTVVRESYALTRRLYLYTHSKHTRPSADSLVVYALSNAGQGVVSRVGFVDLSIKAEPPTVCPACPPNYVQTTYGSQRLSVDFRFVTGRSELDSRALKDSERVAEFAKSSKILLIGFADNSGAQQSNQKLSLERAEKVKQELARQGLANITTQGMGSLMPTASNDTEEGRQKNRRVEVWIQ